MKRESRRERNPIATRSEEAAEIASTLAPPEEQEGAQMKSSQPRRGGAIVVDTAQLNLPKDFIEEDKPTKAFGLEPVVLFILIFFLAFIAFIAYLISLEPQK